MRKGIINYDLRRKEVSFFQDIYGIKLHRMVMEHFVEMPLLTKTVPWFRFNDTFFTLNDGWTIYEGSYRYLKRATINRYGNLFTSEDMK